MAESTYWLPSLLVQRIADEQPIGPRTPKQRIDNDSSFRLILVLAL